MPAALQVLKGGEVVGNREHAFDGRAELMLLHSAGQGFEIAAAASGRDAQGDGVPDRFEDVEARVLSRRIADQVDEPAVPCRGDGTLDGIRADDIDHDVGPNPIGQLHDAARAKRSKGRR